MGTANKQIATRTNVNSKRFGAFVTGTNGGTYMKKCVTKKAVTDIEYLSVNNRNATISVGPTSVNSDFGNTNSVNMYVYQGSQYTSSVRSDNLTISGNDLYCLKYAYTYNSSSTIANVSYSASWPGTASDAKYYALYKRTVTVPTNTVITLSINLNAFYAQSDAQSGMGGLTSGYSVNTITWYPGFIITDASNNNVITTITPSYCTSTVFNKTHSFNTSGYSSINIYFIVNSLNMTFYPQYTEYYTGFGITCSVNMTYNESNYDQTYKLAQYQDIAAKGGTFSCKYAIYNSKSSSAKLDYVRVYIGATSDRSKGTWTQIGSASPGNVDGYKTGDITCTIPSTYSLTKQLYMYVHCGNTNINQQWYSGWGNYVSNFQPSENWGKVDNAKTPVVPVLSDITNVDTIAGSVLNYTEIDSTSGASGGRLHKGILGRTGTRTALFRID